MRWKTLLDDPELMMSEVDKVLRLKRRKVAFQFAEMIIGYAAAEWTDEDLKTFEQRLLKNVYRYRKQRIERYEANAQPPQN
jgi:hypothetical protein